jgi:hypothetical protein
MFVEQSHRHMRADEPSSARQQYALEFRPHSCWFLTR